MLLPSTAYAHCNGKHTGNHPHCTGDGGGDDGSGEYQVSDGVIINDPSGVSGFDFYIIGTPGQDTITAGSGADLIEGGDERDEIHALGDNDSIYGEGGDDSIDGGDGDDQIYGGPGNDSLTGGLGFDLLDGGYGELDGGYGDDYLFFSPGASLGGVTYASDHFDGSFDVDFLDFSYFERGDDDQVIVDLNSNTYDATVSDESGTTIYVQGTLSNIENIWATSGNDTVLGSDLVDNFIYGGEGNDFIDGGSGNDNLIGGQGNDEVYGGPGDDWVGGEPGADLLVGGAGSDVVSGAESGVGDLMDDVLWGGDNITLVDGEADTFHFRKTFGTDTIMDYEQDEIIILTGYIGGFWRDDMSFDVINIDPVGDDIVISFWLKRGGGTGGTIILKGAATKGITIGEQHFTIE
jgi:Ca2+-binding RTX toxin-like protein